VVYSVASHIVPPIFANTGKLLDILEI